MKRTDKQNIYEFEPNFKKNKNNNILLIDFLNKIYSKYKHLPLSKNRQFLLDYIIYKTCNIINYNYQNITLKLINEQYLFDCLISYDKSFINIIDKTIYDIIIYFTYIKDYNIEIESKYYNIFDMYILPKF